MGLAPTPLGAGLASQLGKELASVALAGYWQGYGGWRVTCWAGLLCAGLLRSMINRAGLSPHQVH